MGQKVTFDPVARVITLDVAPVLIGGDLIVDIDVAIDLYSDGKEDWQATESLRRLEFPLRAVGGDPLAGGKKLGSTFFIASDWKIAPHESSHRLRVEGNFYSEDGSNPFMVTAGAFNVFLERDVSVLVESALAQSIEIEDIHAALFHRRTKNVGSGVITIYESDKVTPRALFDSTDDGNQITEITPQ
jgi:hypothetical protein